MIIIYNENPHDEIGQIDDGGTDVAVHRGAYLFQTVAKLISLEVDDQIPTINEGGTIPHLSIHLMLYLPVLYGDSNCHYVLSYVERDEDALTFAAYKIYDVDGLIVIFNGIVVPVRSTRVTHTSRDSLITRVTHSLHDTAVDQVIVEITAGIFGGHKIAKIVNELGGRRNAKI